MFTITYLVLDESPQQHEIKDHDGHSLEQGSVLPISKGLLTLSALPKSRWHTLELLDTIKVRYMQGGVVSLLTSLL